MLDAMLPVPIPRTDELCVAKRGDRDAVLIFLTHAVHPCQWVVSGLSGILGVHVLPTRWRKAEEIMQQAVGFEGPTSNNPPVNISLHIGQC